MKRSLACCALLYTTATTASPPQLPIATMWAPSLSKQPSAGAMLGNFRITFEKTTLTDVMLAVLGGTVLHEGDAGGSVYRLFYSNPGVGYIDRIWIESDGEMGGTDHVVTEIAAERLHNTKPTANCPSLAANMRFVASAGRLRLGVPERKVEFVLGPPSLQRDPWRSFDFQEKSPGPVREDLI